MPRREAILTSALALGLALASAPARAQGDLGIVIQYPPEGATIGATDSTFVFGRVEGAGGEPVEVRVGGVPASVDPVVLLPVYVRHARAHGDVCGDPPGQLVDSFELDGAPDVREVQLSC